MNLPLLIPQHSPLDARWHKRLLECLALPNNLYAYLMPEADRLAQLRQKFDSSNHTDLPVLSPPPSYRQDFEATLDLLAKLKHDLAESETNETIRQLYFDRIDELTTNCQLWLAAADQDTRAFEAANIALYGEPNEAMLAAGCAWLRAFAQGQQDHPETNVRAAAARIQEVLPDLSGDPSLLKPDEQTYYTLRTQHALPGGYLAQLFSPLRLPTQAVSEAEGDAILKQVLQNIGSDYSVADAEDGFWSLRHDTGTVARPASYRLTPASFIGLISHEVGSHLLERMNGFRGPLQLAATGLAHYERGNEGRAFLREQLALGSVEAMQQHYSWEFSITKHLAIGLAVGTLTKRHNFAEIYDILFAIHTLWALLQNPDQSTASKNAADSSWAIATRVLKGTDGKGDAYRKDMVYLEGNVRCWQLAAHNPSRIFLGDRGKFDITNPKHIADLKALGVLS